MPGTARLRGLEDSFNIIAALEASSRYLSELKTQFGNFGLAAAAYNAGEGAVEANGGVPPYTETRDYVPKVLAAWQVAQGLCLTPPELVTDPCVFKVIAAGG